MTTSKYFPVGSKKIPMLILQDILFKKLWEVVSSRTCLALGARKGKKCSEIVEEGGRCRQVFIFLMREEEEEKRGR